MIVSVCVCVCVCVCVRMCVRARMRARVYSKLVFGDGKLCTCRNNHATIM